MRPPAEGSLFLEDLAQQFDGLRPLSFWRQAILHPFQQLFRSTQRFVDSLTLLQLSSQVTAAISRVFLLRFQLSE